MSNNFDADIFCFNPEKKSKFQSSERKMYNQLIEKGFHFEIPYSPAIEDSTKRKNIIHVAHTYHTFFGSKNVIISSDASNPILIRGPYDIIILYPSMIQIDFYKKLSVTVLWVVIFFFL